MDDKFLIINWTNYKSNITITVIKNNPTFAISELFENQTKVLYKEFQNIQFKQLDDLNLTKPFDFNYSVLMIKLFEKDTQIQFDMITNEKDNNNKSDEDEKKGLSSLYIALISIFGFILLLILIILICRCYKKRKKVDITRLTSDYSAEKLMEEI